jgi:hypothetical protein
VAALYRGIPSRSRVVIITITGATIIITADEKTRRRATVARRVESYQGSRLPTSPRLCLPSGALAKLGEVAGAVRRGDLGPTPSFQACRTCSYNTLCPHRADGHS